MHELLTVLDTDVEWVQEHTRLVVRANDWERKGRDGSLFLRGSELHEAEAWFAGQAGKNPPPTELQGAYILASRVAARRRQRLTLAAVSSALGVAIVLATVALVQRGKAVERAQIAGSRELATTAVSQLSRRSRTKRAARAGGRRKAGNCRSCVGAPAVAPRLVPSGSPPWARRRRLGARVQRRRTVARHRCQGWNRADLEHVHEAAVARPAGKRRRRAGRRVQPRRHSARRRRDGRCRSRVDRDNRSTPVHREGRRRSRVRRCVQPRRDTARLGRAGRRRARLGRGRRFGRRRASWPRPTGAKLTGADSAAGSRRRCHVQPGRTPRRDRGRGRHGPSLGRNVR